MCTAVSAGSKSVKHVDSTDLHHGIYLYTKCRSRHFSPHPTQLFLRLCRLPTLHVLPADGAWAMIDKPFVHARLVESVRAIGQPPRCFTGYNVLQEAWSTLLGRCWREEEMHGAGASHTLHLVANKLWYEIANLQLPPLRLLHPATFHISVPLSYHAFIVSLPNHCAWTCIHNLIISPRMSPFFWLNLHNHLSRSEINLNKMVRKMAGHLLIVCNTDKLVIHVTSPLMFFGLNHQDKELYRMHQTSFMTT